MQAKLYAINSPRRLPSLEQLIMVAAWNIGGLAAQECMYQRLPMEIGSPTARK